MMLSHVAEYGKYDTTPSAMFIYNMLNRVGADGVSYDGCGLFGVLGGVQ